MKVKGDFEEISQITQKELSGYTLEFNFRVKWDTPARPLSIKMLLLTAW